MHELLNEVVKNPNSIDGIIIFNTEDSDFVEKSDVEGGGVGETVARINWTPFIEIKEKFNEFHKTCASLAKSEKPTRYWAYFERETVLMIEPYLHFLIIFVSKQGIGRVGFMEEQVDEELKAIEELLDEKK